MPDTGRKLNKKHTFSPSIGDFSKKRCIFAPNSIHLKTENHFLDIV